MIANPLTAAHRLHQVGISAGAVSDLLGVWKAFDPTRVDESWDALQQASLSIIGDRRSQSAALSSNYYRTLRDAAGLKGPLPIVRAVGGWQAAAIVSLAVSGPVGAKAMIAAKRPLADVIDTTFVRVAGVISRHSLNGGRDTLTEYLAKDKVRYRRVTSGHACDFCRMLAGRGAVYVSATSRFRSHDHCHCTAEPDFTGKAKSSTKRSSSTATDTLPAPTPIPVIRPPAPPALLRLPPQAPLPSYVSEPLSRFEDAHRTDDVETAFAVDANGDTVLDKSQGSINRVEFTTDEVQQLRHTVLTHNHPSGRGASSDDLRMLQYANLTELRVARRGDGTTAIRMTDAGRNMGEIRLMKAIKKHDDAIFDENMEKVRARELTPVQAEALHHDEITRRLVSDGILTVEQH